MTYLFKHLRTPQIILGSDDTLTQPGPTTGPRSSLYAEQSPTESGEPSWSRRLGDGTHRLPSSVGTSLLPLPGSRDSSVLQSTTMCSPDRACSGVVRVWCF